MLARRLTTTSYGFLCLVHIITHEVFPLWVLNDKAHGGFGFKVCAHTHACI